jgi:subtilisin family serine protease
MVNWSFYPLHLKKVIFPFIFFLVLSENFLSGQEKTYNFFYRIYFTDKGENDISDFSASDLLSAKAVDRRTKAGIPVPDFRDIPVYSGYVEQISSLGFKLHCTSRWMNTALFKTEIPADINNLLSLPFISDVKIVKRMSKSSSNSDKLRFERTQSEEPPYDQPLLMLNGLVVKNSGFNGQGIMIAVLDGGFSNAENISSLDALRNRQGILGTYDFVKNNEFVYDYHNHGTAVLSVLAGSVAGSIEGTAQGADYWLLRTEDTGSEFPVEEDFWTAGAEFADSIGADIISSSLGYFAFDDPALDYKYSDMDGNSTFVTRAADIAASKGILVVNSAGNERNKTWLHIIAPSDGDSVLAVGAVDGSRIISSFSSAGPSYDRRIKPDVVSQGVSVPVQVQESAVERSSGTSFSCPVISGMCACIMQAVPQAKNADIISELHAASDRFLFPDSLYGYGIPDITVVINKLQERYLIKPENESVVSPNPFDDELKITFRENPEQLRIELYDISGKLIMKMNNRDYISRSIILDDLPNLSPGIYFIRLYTPGGIFVHKLIKIKRAS